MLHYIKNRKLSKQLTIMQIVLPVSLFCLLPLIVIAWHTGHLKTSVAVVSVITLTVAYLIFTLYYIRHLVSQVSNAKKMIDNVVQWKSPESPNSSGSDEVAIIASSVHKLHDDLIRKVALAEQISKGNLQVSNDLAATDPLASSLLSIKENLINIKSDEEKRQWASDGLNRFVEILRSAKNVNDLCRDIIKNLVQILKANQGGIFIADKSTPGEESLEMVACYAYERTKFLTKKIAVWEGLIGQTYLERETINLKEIPDNFVTITSGLGRANPRHLLLVPLKLPDEIVGVVELASFKEFEQHEIASIEKIGENIAHTISSFRVAEDTRKLLQESQALTEQLRSQEEELKQNQEELQATQEEISRKYEALFRQLKDLNYQSKFDQLKSINSTKKRNIEYYFDIIRSQILTFAENRMVIDALKSFKESFYELSKDYTRARVALTKEHLATYYSSEFIPRLNENSDTPQRRESYLPEDDISCILQYHYIANNPHPTGEKSLLDDANDGSSYSRAHAFYHPVIRSFLEKFGYYDIFLIDDKTGYMVYSVFKEVDFATSLLTGHYNTTNFGRVVKEAIHSSDKNFVRLVDFEPYSPSYWVPASFIACPVYDNNHKIGIAVFQMPINKINQILTGGNKWREDGLGETGETFIVGSDSQMRSVSRALIESRSDYLLHLKKRGYDDRTIRQIEKTNTNILLEKVSFDSVGKGLRGVSGTQIEKNDRGEEVLNAYAPLQIPDVRWMILSTMKEVEASKRIDDLRAGKS